MLKNILLLLAVSTGFSLSALAQEAAAAPQRTPFAFSFGSAKSADGFDMYSVSGTAPSMSAEKGHQLKFATTRSSGGGRESWSYFLVGTGKSKSVAQIQTMLAEALRKFPGSAPGAELCKIGDIKYGGELKLVVRSARELEFAFDPAIRSGNPKLSPADAAAFASILRK